MNCTRFATLHLYFLLHAVMYNFTQVIDSSDVVVQVSPVFVMQITTQGSRLSINADVVGIGC